VNNPTVSLQQATASALRQVIGNTNLDEILTSGREQVSEDVKIQLIQILKKYQTGIEITQVALQPAKAPDAVKEAFDDAIKAQEDEQRYINQAEAYRMQVIPQASGEKQRVLSDANAYQQQVVLNAKGETARYLALLPEYQQNPDVTRERLYLGALQNVFTNSTKVFVDQKQGNNTLMYLPLDRLFAKSGRTVVNATDAAPPASNPTTDDAQSAAAVQSNQTLSASNQAGDNFSGYGRESSNPYGFLNEGNR
jgi:membrane protease subunit HflK